MNKVYIWFSRITAEFSTAAFRVGHTMVPGMIRTFATIGQREQRRFQLSNEFFKVDLLRQRGGVDR